MKKTLKCSVKNDFIVVSEMRKQHKTTQSHSMYLKLIAYGVDSITVIPENMIIKYEFKSL